MIFEKTVSEPNFAPTYAKFCKVLFQEIKAESKSLFTSSLINRIQHEFESNVNNANAKKVKLQPLVDKLESCDDSKERLELQAELEDQEYQFRRRAWGTVRFIGEMFKLQSLTNDRVFLCIESLLEHGSEEKLEYMCKLLTTVGHLLESPDNANNARMDKIFRRIQEIIHKSRGNKSGGASSSHFKISSRVRFMMQDVMDLRTRTWDHPHTQSQQQQQTQQLQQQQQQSSQRRGGSGGMPSKQDDKMQSSLSGSMYDKSNRLGNYGGGGNVGGGGNQGNQRHYFQKSQKSQQFMQQHDQQKLNIDLNKLKFTSDEVTQKLGPQTSSYYQWRSSGRYPTNATVSSNTPASLISLNTVSSNVNASNSSGFKRQSSVLGPTTAASSSPMFNNRFQELDRQDKMYDPNASGSSSPQEQKECSDQPDLNKSECQKWLNQLIEELLDAGCSRSNGANSSWQQEAVNEWCNLNARQQKSLLTYVIIDYLHSTAVKRTQRKACAAVFAHLMRVKVCEPQIFNEVYKDLVDELLDLQMDVPNLWTYIFDFVGPLLHEQLLQLKDVWLPQWSGNINFTKRFLHALITYFTTEFGANYTRELWNKDFKLEHGQQFMSDEAWREFINSNGFQYIHDRAYKPPQQTANHPAAILEQVKRIEYLLNEANGCDQVIDYINTNVFINTHFIRSLTTFLCCDYENVMTTTDWSSSSTSRLRHLDPELFRRKCIPLLRRCLDGIEAHEVACLDAIVDAMQQNYDTPTANQLICSVFDLIYDSEVIPKDSFDKWYRAEMLSDSKETNAPNSGDLYSATLTGKPGGATDSVGGARLNEELQVYMEKLL